MRKNMLIILIVLGLLLIMNAAVLSIEAGCTQKPIWKCRDSPKIIKAACEAVVGIAREYGSGCKEASFNYDLSSTECKDELSLKIAKYSPSNKPSAKSTSKSPGASEGEYTKLCTIRTDARSIGDAFVFNSELFIGLKDIVNGPEAMVYRLSSGGSCLVNDGELPDEYAGEAAVNFASFNGRLYVGTENRGGAFRRANAGQWELVHNPDISDKEYSLAIAAGNNGIVVGTSGEGKGSKVYLSSTGDSGNWAERFSGGNVYYYAINFNNAVYMVGYEGDKAKVAKLNADSSSVESEFELDAG